MEARKIKEGIYWVGAVDWDRRMFDDLSSTTSSRSPMVLVIIPF
jgi:flavorubredoxin